MIKEIKTLKFEGLAVLIPNNKTDISALDLVTLICDRENYHPHERVSLLGKINELTEEQCAEIMPKYKLGNHNCGYHDTINRPDVLFSTAKDAFKSMLKELGCYSVNPLQSSPPTTDILFYDSIHDYDVSVEKWKEAQANTGTWLILKKL